MHTKTWLLSSLSIASSIMVASACVLVENFEGYGPLGIGGSCDQPPCSGSGQGGTGLGQGGAGFSSSSGIGGIGGDSITTSSSGSSSGGSVCPMIQCNGTPCESVEILSDSLSGLITMDANSFFIRTTAAPKKIQRFAKPGCTASPFEQPVDAPTVGHPVASDGKYVAWLFNDAVDACLATTLRFCDLDNCQVQEIKVANYWPDRGNISRMELGPDAFYFTTNNGLAGRLAKGSTQPEMLWIDPGATMTKAPYLAYSSLANGKFYTSRLFLGNGIVECMGTADAASGTIWASDAIPNTTPTALVSNISDLGHIIAGQTYVYAHLYSGNTVLNRVPTTGGGLEALLPGTKLKPELDLQHLVIKNGWLYFKAATDTGTHAIARLPVDSPTWSADSAEVLAESTNIRIFAVDDVALYWDECAQSPACPNYHLMARRLAP